jgi:hypothetical protein
MMMKINRAQDSARHSRVPRSYKWYLLGGNVVLAEKFVALTRKPYDADSNPARVDVCAISTNNCKA